MYRDDLEASFARVGALQNELTSAQGQAERDQQRIATLESEIANLRQAIERLGGQPPHPAPIYPARGGTILTLGICALAVCSLLGPIAWLMGNEELRRIRTGQTPGDRLSATTTGRVMGIIATVLFAVVFLSFVVFATGRHHHSR